MKLVIDTNVLFSALYEPSSAPGQLLLLAIEGEVELYAPESVLVELERALRQKLGYDEDAWLGTLAALPVEWMDEETYVSAMPRASAAIRDPGDAPVVALALVLGADIVSGDSDFHPLRRRVARTWKPRDFSATRRKRGPQHRRRRR